MFNNFIKLFNNNKQSKKKRKISSSSKRKTKSRSSITRKPIDTLQRLEKLEFVSKDEIKGYKKKQQIGTGGFGDVFLYVNKNDETDKLAVKFFKKEEENEGKVIEYLTDRTQSDYCEILPLITLKNKPNLFSKTRLVSVMPIMDEVKPGSLQAMEAFSAYTQIKDQIDCLLDYDLYYTDLKPQNIMSKDQKYYLGDLGSIYNRSILEDKSPTYTFESYILSDSKKDPEDFNKPVIRYSMQHLQILNFIDLLKNNNFKKKVKIMMKDGKEGSLNDGDDYLNIFAGSPSLDDIFLVRQVFSIELLQEALKNLNIPAVAYSRLKKDSQKAYDQLLEKDKLRLKSKN
ncbi:MAG: hypothetical protein CMB64_04880 [Euryarchaeota archaeon]|nr:hypothetical protein [Euryarchaeota archaeon]